MSEGQKVDSREVKRPRNDNPQIRATTTHTPSPQPPLNPPNGPLPSQRTQHPLRGAEGQSRPQQGRPQHEQGLPRPQNDDRGFRPKKTKHERRAAATIASSHANAFGEEKDPFAVDLTSLMGIQARKDGFAPDKSKWTIIVSQFFRQENTTVSLIPLTPLQPIPSLTLPSHEGPFPIAGFVPRSVSAQLDHLFPTDSLPKEGLGGIVGTWAFPTPTPGDRSGAGELFEDMYGLQRLAYFPLPIEGAASGEWYMYLRVTEGKTHITGYVIHAASFQRHLIAPAKSLISRRLLPLVLDLDDTVVRLVSDDASPNKYVPIAEAEALAQDRIRSLPDGRRVVVAPGVDAFLDWAKGFFEVAVCSVGDHSYVQGVCEVLDAGQGRLTGLWHSARTEHDYLQGKLHRARKPMVLSGDGFPDPPKDLSTLYAFTHLPGHAQGGGALTWCSLPLIVDDQERSWPPSQHGNIIVIAEREREVERPVPFNVDLGRVRDVLEGVHAEWFGRWDALASGRPDSDLFRLPSPQTLYMNVCRGLAIRYMANEEQ